MSRLVEKIGDILMAAAVLVLGPVFLLGFLVWVALIGAWVIVGAFFLALCGNLEKIHADFNFKTTRKD